MNILAFANSLPDHRQEIKVRHLSTDIIFITVAAVICGAEDLEECIVSIDAMGCQYAIAKDIIQAKANYILAVKNNQKDLYQGIEDTFRFQKVADCLANHELDFGHGRIENRTCYISTNLGNLDIDVS